MIIIKNWSSYQSYKDRRPPWIRFHKSLLDDYNFQSMSADSRALLPMLWLLASENEDPTSGVIDDNITQISFRLRLSVKTIEACLKEIEASKFIELDQSCNESVTKPLRIRNETVTPETETEERQSTETETDIYVDFIDDAVSYYNKFAKSNGLSVCQKLTKARKSKLRARLSDCGGMDGWRIAVDKIAESDFLMGRKTDWKASFDFLLQEKSFTKLMEDGYKTYKGSKLANDARKLLDELGAG